ncbi:hypothetical protein MRB53_016917 [Persea americana]|uniref:Uncharacterized protein n=1 Tax=Persea americana TaxID=3435 RepID=A0ACC2M3I6_PERAE|nr:hypothetical protein MRB53_016917 [Persea americana]
MVARESDDNSSSEYNLPNHTPSGGKQAPNRNNGGRNRGRGSGSKGSGSRGGGGRTVGSSNGGCGSWQRQPSQEQQWQPWIGNGQQWPWPFMPWAVPPYPYPIAPWARPNTQQRQAGVLGPRPQQAYSAAAQPTPTDIEAAMHTLGLTPPDANCWRRGLRGSVAEKRVAILGLAGRKKKTNLVSER